jgi:class 3 adenylate cyclase/tetratricopeptide (TPR) repeat protein
MVDDAVMELGHRSSQASHRRGEERQMTCEHCHQENPEHAKFCRECGSRLPPRCPSCGTPYEAGQKFCTACGARLSSATQMAVPGAPASYTPKHLAEKILTSRSALEGERKQVTVLFCDLTNSTSLAARLGEEPMHGLLSRFFTLALEAVHRYEGTINQFLGDGFMALFGAPVAHEDHARRAALAALEIRRVVGARPEPLDLPASVELRMRMGLHTGPVVVGSIGDNLRMDYTAVGDTTNLAARLQQQAEPGSILISDAVARLVRGYVTLEAMPPLTVKGKDEPIMAHRLLAVGPRRSRLTEDRTLSPFVGRERELNVLHEALSEVQAGHGQVVSILGEPGVGKSRLLHEFHLGLSGRDLAYAEGWCQSFGQAMPYLPWQDLLRASFAISDTDDGQQAREKVSTGLAQLGLDAMRHAPYLLQLLGIQDGTEALAHLTPETIKGRTLETLLQVALSQARQRPVVIAIEDLHWIDKSSEEFLAALADSLTGVPILLVTTARPGYAPPWLGKSYAAQLALRVLPDEAARTIVEATGQRSPLPSQLTQAIVEKAEGNPLFLEELTLAAAAHDPLEALQALPNTIQGVLAARIDRLPEASKRTLQAASVLGREFPRHLLQSICDRRAELPHHLATLKHEEFLFERPALEGTAYVFKHALTQTVAYNSLLAARRQTLHEMAARAVEQRGADRIEEHYEMLAYHYSRSPNVGKAIDYVELANLKAIKANAAADAESHFHTALELYRQLPDTRENRRRRIITVLQQLPVYLLQLKETQYEELLHAHEALAISVEDEGLLGRLYGYIGHCHWFVGRLDEALESGRRAAALCEKAGEMGGAAQAYILMQYVFMHKGELQQTLEYEAQALRAHASAPNLRFYMWALGGSGAALGTVGRFDDGLDKCRVAMAAGEAAADPSIVGQCLWVMAVIFVDQGALDNAVEYAQRAIDIGPTPADKAWPQWVLGWALARRSPEASIQLLEPLDRLFKSTSHQVIVPWTECALGEAYGCAGRAHEAGRILEDAAELSHRSGMKYWEGYAHRLLGELDTEREDAEALASAEGHFATALALFESCGAEPNLARTYAGLGQLRLRQGKVAAARSALNTALEIAERLGMIGEPERVRQLLARMAVSEARSG